MTTTITAACTAPLARIANPAADVATHPVVLTVARGAKRPDDLAVDATWIAGDRVV